MASFAWAKGVKTSGRNLLAAEAEAGVGHHVALSVVGTDRLRDNGYFRAKVAQEQYWGQRVTTVFPRQGAYAHDPKVIGAFPPRLM